MNISKIIISPANAVNKNLPNHQANININFFCHDCRENHY